MKFLYYTTLTLHHIEARQEHSDLNPIDLFTMNEATALSVILELKYKFICYNSSTQHTKMTPLSFCDYCSYFHISLVKEVDHWLTTA